MFWFYWGEGGSLPYLPWLQVKLRVKKLGEKLEEPLAKLLISCDDLHHQVNLLQAGGEKVIAAGLVAERATPVWSLLSASVLPFIKPHLLVCLVKHGRVLDNQFLKIFISINISKRNNCCMQKEENPFL